MKRRLQGLATTTGSSNKRSWKDDEKTGSKDSRAFSDSDAEKELDSTSGKAGTSSDKAYSPNHVIWMDISVAGKPRGKVFFELFGDTAPDAATLMRELCAGPLKGTELHKIVPRQVAEGGDVDPSDSAIEATEKAAREGASSSEKMKHAKAGLLTCKPAGPNGMTSLMFQITLCPSPKLDGAQTVFGQLVAGPEDEPGRLNALHWVSAAGSSAGEPRDTVLVEDCGVCGGMEAEKMTGQPQIMEPPFPPPESQEERYSRAGNVYAALTDAMTSDNVTDALELTEDLVDYLEYTAKKAKEKGGGGGTRMYRSAEIEAELKELRVALETAEHKAGERHAARDKAVEGFENKLGPQVKMQQQRIKELGEILNRLF